MSPEPNADLVVPDAHGVFPETTFPRWRVGDLEHVIDENVEVSMFFFDFVEDGGNLIIVEVVGLDRDSCTACFGDFSCCGVDGSWSVSGTSAGDVDGGTLFSKPNGDSTADSSARAGNNGDVSFEISHLLSPCCMYLMILRGWTGCR